jgi:hypothetical protein
MTVSGHVLKKWSAWDFVTECTNRTRIATSDPDPIFRHEREEAVAWF